MSTHRVVRKYLKTAKAIYLDKNRVRLLSRDLQDIIEQRTKGLNGPLGKRILVDGLPYDILTVKGGTLTVYVRLQSIDSTSDYFVLGGGMGHSKSGHTVVIVNLNASLSAESYYISTNGSDLIQGQIYPVLLHELTHAADIFAAKGVAQVMSEDEARNNRAYYNDPGEVRAYLQEILSEIENGAQIKHLDKMEKMFGSKVPMTILNYSNTWREVSPHLTESNKRLVMKAVAQLILETKEKANAH